MPSVDYYAAPFTVECCCLAINNQMPTPFIQSADVCPLYSNLLCLWGGGDSEVQMGVTVTLFCRAFYIPSKPDTSVDAGSHAGV